MPRKAPSILYTAAEAGALDRPQLASLGGAALIELDRLAASSAPSSSNRSLPASASAAQQPHTQPQRLRMRLLRLPPNFFAAHESLLIGSGHAGTLSGPRELLAPHDLVTLDMTLDALLHALRPYVLHRAGLKLLEVLVHLHHLHRHRPTLLLLTSLP